MRELKYDLSISLNQREIFKKELDLCFGHLVEMDPDTDPAALSRAKKFFLRYLQSPFFSVVDGEAVKDLFLKLYQRYGCWKRERPATVFRAATLLPDHLKNSDPPEAEQKRYLKGQLRNLLNCLREFRRHYRLLEDKGSTVDFNVQEELGVVKESLSEEQYTILQNSIEDQPISPRRAVQSLNLEYGKYFLNATQKGKLAGRQLDRLQQCLQTVTEMVGLNLRLERLVRKKVHGEPVEVTVAPDRAYTSWLDVHASLLEIMESEEVYEEELYERFKNLLQTHHRSFHPYNQILLCEYAQNYLTNAYKKGHLGTKAEQWFWFKFRMDNNLVTPVTTIADGTFLNFVTICCMNGQYADNDRFIANYTKRLPAPRRQDALWMAAILTSFHKKDYLSVIEYINTPVTGNRNAVPQYSLRRLPLRMRANLAIELLGLESELTEEPVASFESAHRVLYAHLDDAEKSGKKYAQGYIQGIRESIKVCKTLRRHYQQGTLVEQQDTIRQTIETTRELPVKGWYLEFLDDVIDSLS